MQSWKVSAKQGSDVPKKSRFAISNEPPFCRRGSLVSSSFITVLNHPSHRKYKRPSHLHTAHAGLEIMWHVDSNPTRRFQAINRGICYTIDSQIESTSVLVESTALWLQSHSWNCIFTLLQIMENRPFGSLLLMRC